MSFTVLFFERYTAAKSVMFNTLRNDVATSIAILDVSRPTNVTTGSIVLIGGATD